MGRHDVSGDMRTTVTDAVVKCVRRVGHDQVDVRMIAREAGCSTGAVYTVAANKRELLLDVREQLIVDFENFLAGDKEFQTADQVLGFVIRGWTREPKISLFLSPLVDYERTVRLPDRVLDPLRSAGIFPAAHTRSEQWWKDVSDCVTSVYAHLSASDQLLMSHAAKRVGIDVNVLAARVLDTPPAPMTPELVEWLDANPVTLRFEGSMIRALYDLLAEDGAETEGISVAMIADRAGTSVASVYRAGGVESLRQAITNQLTMQCVAGLEQLENVPDRFRAVSLRHLAASAKSPALMALWHDAQPNDTLRGLRRTSLFHDWLRYQGAVAREGGWLKPEYADLVDILPSVAIGPVRMWAGAPGHEHRIIEWALSLIDVVTTG